MILIADSGSTKAHWALMNNAGEVIEAHTQGFNPYFQTSFLIEDALRNELSREFLFHSQSGELELFFYGAGCSTPNKISVVMNALRKVFVKAKISVEHDLLASARALCGRKSGISCILGTGSNSCYYNGNEIEANIPSVGYFFGDYGSAGHIGKSLIQSYFDGKLSDDLVKVFSASQEFDREYILENIYQKPLPNRFLASYARIASDYIDHPFIADLIKYCFEQFLIFQIEQYPQHKTHPVNFVGSVAYNHKKLLNEVIEGRGLTPGLIEQSPMQGLIAFHKS